MGCTTAASLRRWSYRRLAGAPQKTSDTNVEKIAPAPYTQQTAGKVYSMTCSGGGGGGGRPQALSQGFPSYKASTAGGLLGWSHRLPMPSIRAMEAQRHERVARSHRQADSIQWQLRRPPAGTSC